MGAEGGVGLGDTLDTLGYAVWKVSGTTATDFPVTAAFALE